SCTAVQSKSMPWHRKRYGAGATTGRPLPRLEIPTDPQVVIPAKAGQKRALRALNSRRLAPKGRAQRVIALQQCSESSHLFDCRETCGGAIPAFAGMTTWGSVGILSRGGGLRTASPCTVTFSVPRHGFVPDSSGPSPERRQGGFRSFGAVDGGH